MDKAMEIFKEFTFDSAHYLPNVPEGHKCKNMHGHTYRVRFYLEGPIDPHTGWVIDFGDIKAVWKPIEQMLDHNLLNDIPGLENPTAEIIAVWLWNKMKSQLPLLSKIELNETPTCGAIYQGENL